MISNGFKLFSKKSVQLRVMCIKFISCVLGCVFIFIEWFSAFRGFVLCVQHKILEKKTKLFFTFSGTNNQDFVKKINSINMRYL